MSNIIPPMLSSTPPPMDDDNLEDDDDDDFGDFSTGDLNYGLDISEPSKISINAWEKTVSPLKGNLEEIDDLKKTSHHNGTSHLILDLHQRDQKIAKDPITTATASQVSVQDNTSQDSFVSMGTDSGLCSVSPNSVDTSPVPEEDRLSPTTPSVNSREESCGSDETVIKPFTVDPDRTLPFPTLSSSSNLSNGDLEERGIPEELNISKSIRSNSNDFDDFEEALQNIAKTSPTDQAPQTRESVSFPPESDSTEFQSPMTQSEVLDSSDIIQDKCDTSLASQMQETETKYIESYDTISEHLPDLIIDTDILNEPRFVIEDINDDSDAEGSEGAPNFVEQGNTDQNDAVESAILESETHTSECDFEEFSAFEAELVPSFAAEFPVEKDDKDEDFSDFSSSAFQEASSPTSFFPPDQSNEGGWATLSNPQAPAASLELDDFDDDFDNFETASPLAINNSQLQLGGVLTSLFPSPPPECAREDVVVASSEAAAEASPVWGNLRDVDTSNALTYQWVTSTSNKLLLTSLGIDARNILFGPKWNVSVPRFAANLGVSPLEPVQAISPLQPTPATSSSSLPTSQAALRPPVSAKSDAAVPDAKFDWTSSGLVNPLDSKNALPLLTALRNSEEAWRKLASEQKRKNTQRSTMGNGF